MSPARYEALGQDVASLIEQFDDAVARRSPYVSEQRLGARIRKLVHQHQEAECLRVTQSQNCGVIRCAACDREDAGIEAAQ